MATVVAEDGEATTTEAEPKQPKAIDKSCLELSYHTSPGTQTKAPNFSNKEQLTGDEFNDSMRLQQLDMNFDSQGNLLGLQSTLQANPYGLTEIE